MRIDRIGHSHSLPQVFIEHLDMARLIKGLRGRVKLGVQRGRTGAKLGGYQQRPLLTVQKLGQAPSVHMQPELILRFFIHSQIRLIIMQVHHLWGPLFRGPRTVPVDVHLRVPVELLAKIIELLNPIILDIIIPIIRATQRSLKNLGHMVDIGTGQQVLQIRVFTGVIGACVALDFSGCFFGPFNLHSHRSSS